MTCIRSFGSLGLISFLCGYGGAPESQLFEHSMLSALPKQLVCDVHDAAAAQKSPILNARMAILVSAPIVFACRAMLCVWLQ